MFVRHSSSSHLSSDENEKIILTACYNFRTRAIREKEKKNELVKLYECVTSTAFCMGINRGVSSCRSIVCRIFDRQPKTFYLFTSKDYIHEYLI